jgi:hypothetical protein
MNFTALEPRSFARSLTPNFVGSVARTLRCEPTQHARRQSLHREICSRILRTRIPFRLALSFLLEKYDGGSNPKSRDLISANYLNARDRLPQRLKR